MPYPSVLRWALAGLTATALSTAGLSVPAHAADEPALIAGATQDFSAAPGERSDLTLSVTNLGDTAVDGAVVTFDTVWAFEDLERFSNCEYTGDGQARACVFDQTLAPGKSYRLVMPFRVRADTRAPSVQEAFFQWLPASGHIAAGVPGTGAAVRLQEGDRIGESTDGNGQRVTATVTGDRGTDLVAIGGTVAGLVGDTVETEMGVRNAGPATLDFSRAGIGAGNVVMRAPEGTSVLSAPGCYRVTAVWALCQTAYLLKVGEAKTWKVTLRIDKSVAGAAAGWVEVNPECTCERFSDDTDVSNNKTPVTVDIVADEVKPVIEDAGLEANTTVPDKISFQPRVTDNHKVAGLHVTGAPAAVTGSCVPQTSSDRWSCTVTQQAAEDRVTDNVLTLTATDAGGTVSDPVMVPVHVDRTAPRFTVSPAPKSVVPSGTVTITLNDLPADTKSVWADGHSLPVPPAAEPWTSTWTASSGTASPTFVAEDRVGNVWEVKTGYVVREVRPVIQQVNNVGPWGSIRLDTGTGSAGPLNHLEYTATSEFPIVRTSWTVVGGMSANTPRFDWDASGSTILVPTVELTVWDAADNSASKSFPVALDRNVSRTLVYPAENTLVRGTSFVTSVTVDDPIGKGYSKLLAPVQLEGSRSSARVSSGKDGPKRVAWQVSDRFGNVANFWRTVIVDNTAPAVSLKSAPRNGSRQTRNFGVTVNAGDKNGIGRVELLVNGKRVATDTKAGWGFTINPKKYGRSFTVQLRVYDKAGNAKLSPKRTYRR
ncbi:Ig-like domain-containing protein [Actinoplanes sp. NPDC020271]|uniref:Ig-like domain-containing protein n=1 Tax=Actinoplanes sp. NPDC020271 TaxID=3363896 RepID=UPI00378D33B3